MIPCAYTVIYPRAVMIINSYTFLADITMSRSFWLEITAMCTYFRRITLNLQQFKQIEQFNSLFLAQSKL